MRNRILHIAVVCACLNLTGMLNASAQVNTIETSFNQYQQKNLHEKLFVHTDKSFYLTGEILWVKVYDVDGATNKPLKISKTAYVDVLDKANNPVMQAKIALNNASGNGSVYIPVNLENGNYKLRAYTSWMKNYSPDYYFEKQISIINPLKSPEQSIAEAPVINYDVQFFPEGGNLLSGVANKVAIRIVGSNGKGANLKGAVINQRNDTVARFQPAKFGLGSFMLSPVKGDTYRAVIKPGNKNIVKDFPAVADEGYAMQLSDDGAGKLTIKVNTNATGQIYLFAHAARTVKVAENVYLNNGSATFTIDKSKLDAGITHFTIFNSNKQPVCERLYFTRPRQKLTVKANANQLSYGIRKKVSIAYNSQTQDGKPVTADLSMAVFRIDSLQKPEQLDIQSYLWLTSELRGNIESPSYYFANATAETDAALDNLMLTQGWRQFDWNNVLSNTAPSFKFLPEYNGHIIVGRMTNIADNTPAVGVIAYLGIPGKRVQMYPAVSDSTGHLLFNTRDMYGPGEIIVQTNTQKDSTYHIEILSPFSEQFSNTTYPALQLNTATQPLLENYSVAMQVQNLYSSAKIKQFYAPAIDTSAFYFRPYKTYMLDDFTRFTTMEEVLREYVSEVNIVKPKNQYHIKTLAETSFLGSDPMVLVDGIPIFNTNKVIAMDPLKVRKLEDVRSRYFYGPTALDGIFSFTTYKGDMGGVEIDPRAVVLDYEGMQMQRKFYSPVYDTDAQTNSHLPDFRNVLYWLPTAGTGINGKNEASFYTSDQPGKYIAVIQGITVNGEAGMGYVSFEVSK
ncbi:hypothetical protein [Mucilaginibacter jinjuensis]|uniref:MG2 domain-containing protein n=1 Tax=Mucilaginibacter jinjuensis TaxID=1176721 RepID=A0ABY7T6U2_9SPHI|nr:hypothetical protein [Mucilaginibacter jinjuensis]WCT12092.1 hypothetical protein PQO05_25525 [Mucilaginibacter jinjuensis]